MLKFLIQEVDKIVEDTERLEAKMKIIIEKKKIMMLYSNNIYNNKI